MIITATNVVAEKCDIRCGMVLADARALVPELEVRDDQIDLAEKLLKRLAGWCIQFSPCVAIDLPNGLILDASGCSHLWGGDLPYLKDIARKIKARGYDSWIAMADTIGAAWAVCHYGNEAVVPEGKHIEAILPLPPEALRLERETVDRLHKLGLHVTRQFINIARPSLRRRFGTHLLMRLDQAVGQEMETIEPVQPIEPYQERLPCLEPIITAIGIEIALKQLLETLCHRLQYEQKGLRSASLKCYRMDGIVEQISIATNRPSYHVEHLFKLFEVNISTIEPALGIELFLLEATKVEDHFPQQEKMWEIGGGLNDIRLSELIDRLIIKTGQESIQRYLPDEHYWPEHSFKPARSLTEEPTAAWRGDKLRPILLLPEPDLIEVTAPIPDYPPMLFRYRGKLHKIVKADGPERIEQEWWLQQGQHRDYYRVEDEEGHRYWLFRLGHYSDMQYQWFIHGFFD